jgi:hypothetical protein
MRGLNPSEAAAQKLHVMLMAGQPTTNCHPVRVGVSKAGVSYNLYPDRFTCPMAFRRSCERMVDSLNRKGGKVFLTETAPLSALLPIHGRASR